MGLKLVLLVTIFVVGCATGQYFDTAKTSSIHVDGKIQYLVKCLQDDPNHQEAKTLLKEYYTRSVEEHLQKSNSLARSNKYYLAIGELDSIVMLNKLVSSWLRDSLQDIGSQRSQLITQAGQYYYAEGERAESQGNHREAAKNYRMAANYTPGYRNVEEKYRNSAQMGTLRVCILPFENKNQQFPTLGDDLANEILSTTANMNPEFIEFVSRNRMEALAEERNLHLPDIMTAEDIANLDKLMPADIFVFGNITNVYAENGEWKVEQYRDEAVRRDPNTGQMYTVYAVVSRFHKTNIARLKVSYQEVEVKTSKIGGQKVAEKETKDYYEYAQFQGDEYALSPRSRQLLARQQAEPKDSMLMIQDLVGVIGKELGTSLFRKHKK